MKILLVGDYPPPHGGVSIHVRQLHHFLRNQGVQTTVLDIGKGGRPAPDVIPVHTGPQLALALWRHLSDGWIPHVHTSGNNPKAWVVAGAIASACRIGRAPSVITLHSGLLPAYLAESLERRVFARATLAAYAQVVAVSDAVAEALHGCGVPASKILVYPAFCASEVRPGEAPAGFEVARGRRTPLLAMAHHPSPVYGRELMFRALALLAERHPRAGLAVFGPGTRSVDFLADARKYGVEELIEDFGELENDRALGLMKGCDAFVRPTSADGDSISVREALALGVRCVASDVCARPSGALTFKAGDPRDLAERITAALEAGPVRTAAPDAGPVLLELYRGLGGAPRGDTTVAGEGASAGA
ncbi:MAG TPA: glycosyltransferase family 4 protein [Longimicrobium sp.]|nr:glycosyltransferase family 4 protein [Longimicrobium sp.]